MSQKCGQCGKEMQEYALGCWRCGGCGCQLRSSYAPNRQTNGDYLRTATPEQIAAGLATVIIGIMRSDASIAEASIVAEIEDWLNERKE